MKTGLFFGSFNPVHIGHMAIANYLLEYNDLDRIWFIISPQSPFKNKSKLLADYQRLELVQREIDDDLRLKASNIEFGLPKPSFTIDTITYLREKYPNMDFNLIIGSDQLPSFHKWKNADILRETCKFLVYPRPGITDHQLLKEPEFIVVDAPLMEVSSSFIRKSIKEGKDIRHFLPPQVWEYIKEMHFYE